MPENRILVVGSSNTDMVVKSRTLPKPGETVTGGGFLLAAGGKGANQAVAAARLGGRVTFVTKVGTDMFGEQAILGYEKEKIDTSLIGRENGAATGVALILVDDRGENLISVASGANFCWHDADIDKIRSIIDKVAMLVLQLEIPLDTVVRIAEIAAAADVPVLLDPAPAPREPLPPELLRYVSYIKPNEHEAAMLLGEKRGDGTLESAVRAAGALLDSGVRKAAVITLGSQGAMLLEKNGRPKHLPAPRITPVDTTAAGDAFTGALAYRLAEGDAPESAVRFANQVAALSATRLGAQPSLPTSDEVLKQMKSST